MEDSTSCFSDVGSSMEFGSSTRNSSPLPDSPVGFSSSIRNNNPHSDIQNAAKQVQACIASTSWQLRNDYKHRQAVYQSWCPPPTGLKSSQHTTSPGNRQQSSLLCSHGSSPRASISSLWAAGERIGMLLQQQQQEGQQAAGLASGGSFADFFAARKSAAAGSPDPPRAAAAGGSSIPIIAALAQDVRATAVGNTARPVSPLMMKCLLGNQVTTPLLLEKLRQQAAAQQDTVSAGQQGQLFPSSNSPPRSHGSSGTQGSMASCSAVGVHGGLSTGRGSSSVGELSLWGEPLNVSPVSPHRPAAAGYPAAGPSARAGADMQDSRPPSPAVLSLLGTDHNIAPVVVAAVGEGCGPDVSPYNVARPCSASHDPKACCRTRSCSPTAYRAEGGSRAGSRSRSCSPQPKQLICCGCRRQHTLQQHSKCCHLCGNCCKSRGSCASKPLSYGSSIGAGQRLGGSSIPAVAAAMQGPVSAEASGVSTSTTSTCPCIKAYKQGCRDTLQQVNSASSNSMPGTAAARAAAAPHLSAAVQQQPSGRDKFEAGLPGRSPAQDASTLQDNSQAGYAPVPAPAAAQRAGRELSYHSRQSSAARSTASGDEQATAAAGMVSAAAAAAAPTDEPEDLVQTAFLEVHAAQQNLINQGAAADARDVEELTLILQQVLPAAEPQHESLLKEVLSRQQRLLAMQDAYLAQCEAFEDNTWPQVPPLRLPSELGGQRRGAGSQGSTAAAETHPSESQQQGWEGQRSHSVHHAGLQEQQQQRQGVRLDYEGASTRTPSTNSSASSGSGSRPSVYVTPDSLAELMSREDRLAAAAAAYETFESSSGKPLQQVHEAGRGTAGTRSSRGPWASAASTVDANTGRPVHAAAGAPQQQQDHAGSYLQHGQLGFEGGAAPAYAVDSLSDSEVGLDEHSRPLVHYMLSQGGGGSRHVVQDATSQVQEGRPASFSRAASSSRMPQSGAGSHPGPSNTANRSPSIRSVADSAWSVQVVPGAAAMAGAQQMQQVQCNTAVHAAEASEPAWSAGGAQPPIQSTSRGAGASDNGQGPAGPHSSRVSGASSATAAAGAVPMLNLSGAALDTETAKLAGLAVDPRVLPGLTPRLRDDVEAAGSLQELAAAISRGGAGRQDSTDSRSSMQAARGVDGRAPAPATPGRPGVGQAAAAFADGQGGGSSAGGSAGGMQSLRSTSVRFQEASQGTPQSPASKGVVNMSAGQLLEQQQQQWASRHQQQHEHSRKSATGRAGSFELPDSNPSTHENSYQSLDDMQNAAVYASSTQPAMPIQPKGQLVHSEGTAAAGVRAPGPQQSLAGVQQGVAVQQAHQEQMLTPRAIALQQQQQLRQSSSSLNSPSSLLDAAARARALASGGGGSRHSTGGPMSPFSSRLQSPRASLAAAAAAAAAVCSGGGSRVSRQASEVHSPRFLSQETHLKPLVAAAAAAAAAESPRGRSSTGTASLPQQQQQHAQAAEVHGARLSADASGSWRERQLAMQQELSAQQQQLARIRSRTSSVATTPAAPSLLRSVSRASDFGSIASSTAAPAALEAQHRHSTQQQEQRQSAQSASGAQQQPQQQRPLSQAQAQPPQLQPLSPHHARGSSLHIEPSSVSTVSAAHVREEASTPLHVLDAILCDALKQRAKSRLMKQALQGWRQHTAGRKARAALRRAGSVDSRDSPVKQSQQQQQQDGQAPSSRPGSSHALRISLQGLNKNVLKQSLGQLLQGRLDEATADTDSLEIVVSGQLRLQSSPSPRQRTASPPPQQRQHATSSGSSGSDGSLGSSTIRRFEEQLLATREAVAAAAERAGRAPLQGVLRDMQSMISRMEAVCTAEGNADAAAAVAGASCGSPNRGSPHQGYRQSPHHSPHAQQQHSPRQQSKYHRSPSGPIAGRGRSPVPTMACSSPQHLTYSTSRRPGSAGSSLGEWQEAQAQSPRGAGAGLLQPCSSAFARNRSPRRQGQGAKVKSPDKHKLRGRLHWIQDRLAKLEVKMNQASAMSEPCSCNAAGCVHRLSLLPQQQSYWGRGEQEQWGSGGACCCSLQGKRDLLVGRMQQELEELQVELMQLGTNMPGAYSSSNGC